MIGKTLFKTVLICITWGSVIHASKLAFANKSSVLQVNSGAGFIVENALSGLSGTWIKDEGATIDGENISFTDGVFQEGTNNKKTITGTLAPGNINKIYLDGDKHLTGKRGTVVQSIEVSGKNNRIDGDFSISNDITLQDGNTTLSIDIISNIKSNVYLNGGELYIREDDLGFVDRKKIVGPGKIYVNGNRLIFGSKPLHFQEDLYFIDAEDIQFNENITLDGTWTFSGDAIIEGNLNLFNLSDLGKIIVDRGSSLLIKNMSLYNVGNGKLFCMDNTCTITFQNVKIYLSSDYTFSIGKFATIDQVTFLGNSKFIYQSPEASIITSKSILTLDQGITFSYDPGCTRKDLIMFEDGYSTLALNGATLHATLTGMQLTKGSLVVNNNSYLSAENITLLDKGITYTLFDEGITIGNDNAVDDLYCQNLKGASLELKSGSLKYRNVLPTSWAMEKNQSAIVIDVNCNLYLYQDLNIAPGFLQYKGRGGFFYAPGKKTNCSWSVDGYIDYLELD